MDVRAYIQLMNTIEALKCNTRHSWTSSGRRESVAEHSWRLALMAYFVKDEFPEADIDKVILMCLCHDLGEAFTGDIPAFEKTAADEIAEQNAIGAFTARLAEPYGSGLTRLFAEMAEMKTLEARIYKALDKTEAILQHNEADIATWLPLEYHENLVYGGDEVAFSKYLSDLKAELNRDSIRKIEAAEK
ncbi:MAG TPA: HD domain-containing protein [Smithellaceae bacterium]|nr:HD domain-containing protein [Smithellaceae bacterium]HPK17003.1 HD domain-containing protein [Clostridia bacterium]